MSIIAATGAAAQGDWWDSPGVRSHESQDRSQPHVIFGDPDGRDEDEARSRNGRGRERRAERDRRDESWDDDRGREESWGHAEGYAPNRPGDRQRGDGPAFCRNGRGHPVHGRQWCIDKGFGLERDQYDRRYDNRRYNHRRYDERRYTRPRWQRPRWQRPRWHDIVFRRTPRRDGAILRGRALRRTLDRRTWRRLHAVQRQLGARGPVEGRWVQPPHSRTRVLQLRAGRVPLAELIDYNGDRRVDLVVVNRW